MYQTIEDGIGESRIPERLMPVLHGQLAGDNGSAAVITIFQQLQQVSTIFITERGEAPIIE